MSENKAPATKEYILSELKRVAARFNNSYFQKREFSYFAKEVSNRDVTTTFGSWNRALREIGITDIPKRPKRKRPTKKRAPSSDALLIELVKQWLELGQEPTELMWQQGFHKHTTAAYIKEFGSWTQAIEAAKNLPESVEQQLFPEDSTQNSQEVYPTNHKHAIPEKMWDDVLMRAQQRCSSCGRVTLPDEGVIVNVVYIKAPSKGGKLAMSNLKTLCNICVAESKKKRRWY